MSTQLNNLLFLDLETVSCVSSFEELQEPLATFWLKKAGFLRAETEAEKKALFAKKAGIFAEFGKIIVISLGWFTQDEQGNRVLHVKGMSHHDEKELLEAFKQFLATFRTQNPQLCGHNIKEFDVPYLARRMTVHGMPLPGVLDVAGKKPWEVNHIDTMELWKFGDRKNYTSLDLLAHLFDIPSSKSTMQGDEVNDYYYVRKDLQAIEKYCQEDVVATARLFCKLQFLPLPTSIVLA